jgi:hypothetical protein
MELREGGGPISLRLYKENKQLWDWEKKMYLLYILPGLQTLMASLF